MLHIPFHNYKYIGGPSTFMRNLKAYLDKTGFRYTNSAEKTTSLFFPIKHDIESVKEIKHRGGKIIQRLDGIYYPSKHGEKYLEINRPTKEIYQNYSDHIIFQSEYSRRQVFALVGEIPANKYSIIVNGVNKSIFYPSEKQTPLNGKFIFVTTGNFRNIDMIEPVVKAFDELQTRFDFELHIIGPIANNDIKHFFRRKYIHCHGTKTLHEIAKLLQQSHVFIYSHLNPPCPNSVVEAISCGLPVVGFNSGAMSELCFFAKDLLADVSSDVFQEYEDFHSSKLAEKIKLVVENFESYKKTALEYAHLYPFEKCGEQYVEVFINIKPSNRVNLMLTITNLYNNIKQNNLQKWIIRIFRKTVRLFYR